MFLLFPIFAFAGQKVVLKMVAPAEGTAESSSHSMSFDYLNENTARMDVVLSGNHNGSSYHLFRDGKVYGVYTMNGKTTVVDVSSMKGLRNMMSRSNPNAATSQIKILELSSTGKVENVAGIEGDVYQIVWRDGKGKLHDETAVLSGDPRAKEWTTHWLKASNKLQLAILGKVPESNVSDRLKKEGKGLLRLGNSIKVTSLTQSRNNNQFELPAEPTAIPDFAAGTQMPGEMGSTPSPEVQQAMDRAMKSGESVPSTEEQQGVVSKKIEEQKKRQGEKIDAKVNQKVDESVDNAVDKTLDKVFKGLGGLFD
jgi:hypothetical protein